MCEFDPEILCQPPNLRVCGKDLRSYNVSENQDFITLMANNFEKFKIYRSSKNQKVYLVATKKRCGPCKLRRRGNHCDKRCSCSGEFKEEYFEYKARISECTGIVFDDCDPVNLVYTSCDPCSKEKCRVYIRGGACKPVYFYIAGCKPSKLPCNLRRIFDDPDCCPERRQHCNYDYFYRTLYYGVKNKYCSDCGCEPLVQF